MTTGFDPEAEQEVDFGRYRRLLAARWWLPVLGLVVGAVIGYLIALGGSQVYKATATLYLGQPYSSSGTQQLQSVQTNPSTVKQIAHADSVIATVSSQCKAKPALFRGGISTQSVSGNISKNGQTPLVTLTVQSKKRKVATCAGNALAREVVDKLGRFAEQKIKNFEQQIGVYNAEISAINAGLRGSNLGTTDKLILQTRLTTDQTQKLTLTQLLQQAALVEKPSILTSAHASRVTARSRRNSVVVAALIGLVLGAIVALMWDGIAAGWNRRRTVAV
jgi:capsular polysaccharide biosynthesis protein